jgi:DNA invertase Pin-like site-specific DNA recombinase
MKIALYLRVSTDRQTTDSQAVELRDYCKRRGWNQTQEFSDTASGAKFTRDGLDAMMREVRKGRIDAVVAYKLDRLGRSLPHLAQLVGEMTGQALTHELVWLAFVARAAVTLLLVQGVRDDKPDDDDDDHRR